LFSNILDEIMTTVVTVYMSETETDSAIIFDSLLDEEIVLAVEEEMFSPPLLSRGPMSFHASAVKESDNKDDIKDNDEEEDSVDDDAVFSTSSPPNADESVEGESDGGVQKLDVSGPVLGDH
jgi:hypothetical protein